MSNQGEAAGQAGDASVSARDTLRQTAASMPDGPEKDRIAAMAEALASPVDVLRLLADEAEEASRSIALKIEGMEETLRSKVDEAREYRRQADELES